MPIRARAYVLGSVLILLSHLWLIQVELVRWSLFTNVVPYCNALCIFTALIGINSLVAWLSRSRSPMLNRGELLTVFAMMCVGSALASAQMGQMLVAILPWMEQYAGQGNDFQKTLYPFMNKSVLVTDAVAVKNFYYGNSSIYLPENYRPWLFPILFWATFVVVLMWTMVCISSLLRRRWTEAERLSYPTTFLPVEMTAGKPFWTNRFFWAGLAIAMLITGYNGIAYLYPTLPMVPIKRQSPFAAGFLSPPWSDVGDVQVSFYLYAIGLSFLMPLDLSFSLWFFYFAYKAQLYFASTWGVIGNSTQGAGFDNRPPYEKSQSFGAYMSVTFLAVWTARHYLGQVWETAFGKGPKPLDDSTEPMRYRTAIIGLAAGTVILALFLAYLGMPPLVGIAFFLIFYALCVMIARIRAEFGFPVHDMHQAGPMHPLLASFGSNAMGAKTMGVFGLTFWFNRTYFANPTPHALEALRMAEAGPSRQRDMMKAIMIASVVAAVGVFWAYLNTAYTAGAATARMMGKLWAWEFPNDGFTTVGNWLGTAGTSNSPALKAVGAGFVIATLMGYLRQRIGWFSLHPLGYAVAPSWGMHQIWLPIFVGWLIKAVVTRYGGLRLYRRAVPMFLGLILGEMLVGGFWTLYGIVIGIRAYDFWP